MKITNLDNLVVLEDEKGDLLKFSKYLNYQIANKFKGQNVVIDLLKNKDLSLEQLLCFLSISNNHRALKNTLVILNNALNPDDIPEEIIVVPTLVEAQDIIEMEDIERNLEF